MSNWPTLGLTAALVLITGYYAWQNKRMVDELRLQRAEMIHQSHVQQLIQQYERRVAILRGVLRCLGYVLRDGRITPEVIPGLLEATSEKNYLLNEDVCRYLEEIYGACVKTWVNQHQWADLPVGEQRTKLVSEHAKLIAWLVYQPAQLRERFTPYLRVEGKI